MFLNGGGIHELDQRGERIVDESFLVLFNGHYEPMTFTLPDATYGEAWTVVVDTAAPMLDQASDEPRSAKAGADIDVEQRSVIVLQRAF
jgi:glycogen operon protein